MQMWTPFPPGSYGTNTGHGAQLLEQVCLRTEFPGFLSQSKHGEPPSYKYTPYG